VIKGYTQIFGVDYFNTFAFVSILDTIILVLTVDVQMGWKVFQLDIKSTF